MSNPSVTASILVDDKATPRLREIMELSQRMARVSKDAFNESGGDRYAAGLRQATAAAQQHLTVLEKMHKMQSAIAGTAAGFVGAKAIASAKHAFTDYLPYNREVIYQGAIQGYSKKEMALLEKQRVDAATVYGLKPEDTLHAQQAFVTRNFSAVITEAGTKQAIILSKALNVNAEEAAKMVEGLVFGQSIHLKDAATARLQTSRAADQAAMAAKKGAMSSEDIKQLAIYGMAPSIAAGLSPEQVFATGMTFKRANIDGTQAGTFLRAASSRLMAPTSMGRDAMTLMLARQGKTLDDYMAGGSISPEDMDKALAQNGNGRRLTPKGIASFNKSIDEGMESGDPEKDVMGSRAAFSEAARKALEDSGQEFDKGELKQLTKHMVRLRDIALEKANLGKLYENIIHNATTQEKIKIFGDKQGGRAGSLNAEQYDEYLEAQKHASGYATKIAEERMQGLAAAVDRLSASMDVASKQMVAANERWLTPVSDAAGKAVAAFTGLSDGTKGALSVAGGLGATAGMASAGSTVLSLIASFGNVAVSANTAAASLARVGVAGAVPSGALDKAGKGATVLGGAASVLGYSALGVTGISLALEGLNRIPSGGSRASRGTRAGGSAASATGGEFEDLIHDGGGRFGSYRSGAFAKSRGSTSEALRSLGLDDAPQTSGWQDSARARVTPPSEVGDSKWGSGAISKAIDVTGTVTGSAELHQSMTLTLQPSQYFVSIVQRAESVANMGLTGRLGTSMQGPGDNGTKPSGGPLTGAQ